MNKPRSVAPMRTAKIGYIVISAALCLLGIMLIAVPDFSAALLGIICGIILTLFGVIKLVGYFSKDLYRLAFQYDLIFGIVLIAVGVVILVRPESVLNFICIALGLTILADGISKIRISLESKSFGIREWWLILVSAILTSAMGLVLMFRPAQSVRVMMIILGVTLLLEGILNLCTVITAVKIIKHQQPDVIEVTEYTVK
ncbi:MAG: DUF308 domain-containing protein [Oscillospiraceae bacterium]|nr:DUF308 domain-containing protein [Oscillospiraceae bacterium]